MNITHRRGILSVWAGLAMGLLVAHPPGAAAMLQGGEQNSAKQVTVQLRIAGMTCPACAKGLEASFRNMKGVNKAAVDYDAGRAVVTFDPAKHSLDSLAKFVKSCGYQVKESKVV